MNLEWKWVNNERDAFHFTTDQSGRLEVRGLAYREGYKLIETQAPEGYALPSNDRVANTFNVAKGTYTTTNGVAYDPTDSNNPTESVDGKSGSATRVNNRNVTIPQTGGIGSLIFIVAGLALMGVAFVAMKRRNSYEEA